MKNEPARRMTASAGGETLATIERYPGFETRVSWIDQAGGHPFAVIEAGPTSAYDTRRTHWVHIKPAEIDTVLVGLGEARARSIAKRKAGPPERFAPRARAQVDLRDTRVLRHWERSDGTRARVVVVAGAGVPAFAAVQVGNASPTFAGAITAPVRGADLRAHEIDEVIAALHEAKALIAEHNGQRKGVTE